jgi:hypothetical protein
VTLFDFDAYANAIVAETAADGTSSNIRFGRQIAVLRLHGSTSLDIPVHK